VPNILAGPELNVAHATAFVLGGIFLAYPYLIAREARKQYRKVALQREPFVMDVDDVGIHLRSPTVDAKIAWSAYSGFADNKHIFILLHQGGRVGTAISNRSLTPEQISELRALFETHLPHK
jgi:YcxB-like protein